MPKSKLNEAPESSYTPPPPSISLSGDDVKKYLGTTKLAYDQTVQLKGKFRVREIGDGYGEDDEIRVVLELVESSDKEFTVEDDEA